MSYPTLKFNRLTAIASRKACPVVLRQNQDRFEILAFRHPIAGCQLVKRLHSA
jgi:hypothetical protein